MNRHDHRQRLLPLLLLRHVRQPAVRPLLPAIVARTRRIESKRRPRHRGVALAESDQFLRPEPVDRVAHDGRPPLQHGLHAPVRPLDAVAGQIQRPTLVSRQGHLIRGHLRRQRLQLRCVLDQILFLARLQHRLDRAEVLVDIPRTGVHSRPFFRSGPSRRTRDPRQFPVQPVAEIPQVGFRHLSYDRIHSPIVAGPSLPAAQVRTLIRQRRFRLPLLAVFPLHKFRPRLPHGPTCTHRRTLLR